jgi:hypothetical protein
VLLLEFEILAGEAEWFSTGVQEVGSNADFRTSMARMALRLLRSMSLRKRMADRARAALSVVKSFSIAGPAGIRFQLDVDAAPGSADTGDIEQDLADLLVEIGEVARAGATGALLLIDEMQNLDAASLGALCMALHRVSQRDLPVALAGAGLPTLPSMLRAAKPYASRLFSYHTLGQLSEAEARLALVGPAGLQGVEFRKGAVEFVVERSGGHPYFLQEYGRVLWDEIDSPPSVAVRTTEANAAHAATRSSVHLTFAGSSSWGSTEPVSALTVGGSTSVRGRRSDERKAALRLGARCRVTHAPGAVTIRW